MRWPPHAAEKFGGIFKRDRVPRIFVRAMPLQPAVRLYAKGELLLRCQKSRQCGFVDFALHGMQVMEYAHAVVRTRG